MEKELSILIINYMTYDLTVNAIESVYKYTQNVDYEIILVDNGSENDDALKLEEYISNNRPEVKYIKSEKNVGFGSGNNIALDHAIGEYILFMNSDCELKGNQIDKCIDYYKQHEDIGALGLRLMMPDGTLDTGSRRGFPTPMTSLCYFLRLHKLTNNPKYDRYIMTHIDEYQKADVDTITGAFLFTKRAVLDNVGTFDEEFFMYGEDVDLCYRIHQKGYRQVYNPELGSVTHYRGMSGAKRKYKTRINFYQSMILFYKKHYEKKYNFIVTLMVYIGIGIFCCLALLKSVITGR